MDSSFSLTTCGAALGIFTLFCTLFFMLYKKYRFRPNNKTMSSSSLSLSSPSLSLSHNRKHHVFPSFHGPDVRKSFLSHVLKEFKSKGIDSFIDNNIERSKSIGPELKKAIQGSRIAIVLISKKYASSSWCLDELVEIMKCREELGQIVMVIFCDGVDPTDVKKQVGDFGKVFRKTCAGKTKEVIGNWSQALAKVGTIAGYHLRQWPDEVVMIEKIAVDVSNMLNNFAPSRDFDGLVGMGAHIRNMRTLLSLDLDEVRMIGICGPSGIGKSTIARFLFNQLSSSFELSTIMVNIKRCYPRPCLDEYSAQLQLQNQMMSQIFNHQDIVISHLGVAEERLKGKKVLVVLDDVDRSGQVDALAKELRWFGSGSRIIITTQDHRLLKAQGVNLIYKVGFPERSEAFQIFCMYAFGQNFPKYGFEELAWDVVNLVGKLPLGLKVMGSHFRRLSVKEWKKELQKLRNHLDKDIESILMFSYESLYDEDKYLFLHIAIFFNGEKIEKVEDHLSESFLDVAQGLHVLAEKSLISMDWGRIRMHNLLAQLGMEIVSKQYGQGPVKRQFLVRSRDIREALSDDTTTDNRSVIGITLDYDVLDKLDISERVFEGMSNLQFLRLYHYKYVVHPNNMYLLQGLSYQRLKLRLLDWTYFPMTSLPSIFNMKFLVELNMRVSKLQKLWEGIQPLSNLKWMDLSYSKNLKELPDLSTATKLKKLKLRWCSSLVEIPSSIGNATNLQRLNLGECSSLVKLPSSIGNAINLKKLTLKGCSMLAKIPSSIASATNLKELKLRGCSNLVKISSSIGNAINLKKLNLKGCSNLVEIPSSIGNATYLKKLYFSGCSGLVEIPSSIGNAINLEKLYLNGCSSLVEIPSSIWNATNLEILNLSGCSNLVEIPPSIGNLIYLEDLNLSGCSSLVKLPFSIGNCTRLEKLDLRDCSSLVKLPSSIGNLHRLLKLNLQGCSNLKVLPTNINMKSLNSLKLTGCSLLEKFPEISTRISYLDLSGTAITEVPPSISLWSRLETLHISYGENLKELSLALDSITELHLRDAEIQELGLWVQGFFRLRLLNLSGCRKLVSLPQLPDSLQVLDAGNCESLERLDCSFSNPDICLSFQNCFKLNQEARDLIIQTSNRGVSVLPGGEVPAYFSNRASRNLVTVKMNERPLCTTVRFKACIVLVDEREYEVDDGEVASVYCSITSKQNALTASRSDRHILNQTLTEHLYTFHVEAEEVTSTELVFEFVLVPDTINDSWMIKECGILQLLE